MFLSRRNRILLNEIAFQLIVAVISLIVLVPIAIMLFGSVKTADEAARLSLSLPTEWHLDNYLIVFRDGNIGRALLNSIFITGTSVIVVVVSSAMAAFYLVRRNTKWNNFMMQLYFLGMVAPISIITTIQLLQWMNLNGTYFSVIMIFVAINMSFSVFLFSGSVKAIPRELDEAGIMDGCGTGRLFFRIIFPLLIPVAVTCSIVAFMAVWNDINIPLFFLNRSDKWTIPLTVYGFFGRYLRNWNLVFADLVISAAPVAFVYMFAQKFIIDGMTSGSIKG